MPRKIFQLNEGFTGYTSWDKKQEVIKIIKSSGLSPKINAKVLIIYDDKENYIQLQIDDSYDILKPNGLRLLVRKCSPELSDKLKQFIENN